MAIQEKRYTIDDLREISSDDTRLELDEGILVEMSPTGAVHGVVALVLGVLIFQFVDAHDLGEVAGAETGFTLSVDPPILRAPDIGFIAKARLSEKTEPDFYPFAPDFAVEVVSPTDRAGQIRRKVGQYLSAGTRLVWIVYPEDKVIDVYRPGEPTVTFKIGDVLDGGDVLPGLKIPVQDVFRKLR